jgi:hypothetical protein
MKTKIHGHKSSIKICRSKNIFACLAVIAVTTLAACNSGNDKTADAKQGDTAKAAHQQVTADTAGTATATVTNTAAVAIKEIITGYLQLKNAFTKDNTNDAATAGVALEAAFKNFDKTNLTVQQKKTFEDIQDDAKEHAEHIGKNGGNIKHQREHFEMLSKDMADLVKAFGTGGQTLYKDFCPMYNDNKGAYWISETKDIKNPYLGKAMPTCGVVKEEIK